MNIIKIIIINYNLDIIYKQIFLIKIIYFLNYIKIMKKFRKNLIKL